MFTERTSYFLSEFGVKSNAWVYRQAADALDYGTCQTHTCRLEGEFIYLMLVFICFLIEKKKANSE